MITSTRRWLMGAGTSMRPMSDTGISGWCPGGATVEREVSDNFGKGQKLEIDLNDPDAGVAMRAAQAITDRYEDVRVNVVDPGTLEVTLPISLSPVRFTGAMDEIAVTPGESDRVVMDERTGTIVVGGAVTVGKAAISHGSLTVTIEPTPPGAGSARTNTRRRRTKNDSSSPASDSRPQTSAGICPGSWVIWRLTH